METKDIQIQIFILNHFVYEEQSTVSFKLVLTTVDGKVCRSLIDTKSTQSCYVCKAKPREMNDLKSTNKHNYKLLTYFHQRL